MYILQLDGLMTTEADQMWSTVATDLTVGTWVLDTGSSLMTVIPGLVMTNIALNIVHD